MTEQVGQASNQVKRPLRYGLISILLGLAGVGCFVVMVKFDKVEKMSWLGHLGGMAFILLELMAFYAALLGAIRVAWCAATEKGRTLLNPGDVMLLILGGGLPLFFIVQAVHSIMPTRHGRAEIIAQQVFGAEMEELGEAMAAYSRAHDGKYPTPEKWCDVLMTEAENLPPGSLRYLRGKTGHCHLAMNPLADPCSAPEVVLLFECHEGWNQCGGPEMLVLRHQHGRSCAVLFGNGHVEFIEAEKVPLLRWEGKASGIRQQAAPTSQEQPQPP
jgi:hypothetical protein